MNRHELADLGGGTPSGLLAARAALMPNKTALVFGDVELSYRQLNDNATSIARGLLALGLERSDTIAFFLRNRPEYLTVGFAAARAGLIGVPINTAFKGDFLRSPLQRTDVRVVVTEAALAEQWSTLGEVPPSVHTVIFVDGVPADLPRSAARVLTLEDLSADAPRDLALPELLPSDPNSILFTSGTTGRSKGVVCPHLMAVTMAREGAHAFGITPRDRLFTCFPMYHGMATVLTCYAAIYAGATAILSPGFSMTTFWDEVRTSGATQFNALGAVLHLLLSAPESATDRDHSVTRVFSAPAPPDALYRFEQRFGVHLIEGYGQTEIKNVLYNPRDARRVGSMGLPTASSIVEIHDERGDKLPPGAVGEIVYRPRQAHIMTSGYLEDDEATLAATRGLWWHTGDLGSVDQNGYFYFFDRQTDSLRRRGENISSAEVEEVLGGYPGVVVAAAIRAPSELGESELLAIVQVDEPIGFDHEALWRYCVQTMPRFMVPRYIRAVGALPFTPTGKIRKVELRDAGLAGDTWDAIAEGLTVPR